MRQILNISNILYLAWTIVILILIFSGKIVFGQGIGDMVYLILIFVLQIIFAYLFYLNIKRKLFSPLLVTILLVVSIVLLTLKMTIYRGFEYPWNGKFFFE